MSLFEGRPHALAATRRALLYTDPSALPWSEAEFWDRYRRACAAIAREEFETIEASIAHRAFRATMGVQA